jgi:hypothetical protein
MRLRLLALLTLVLATSFSLLPGRDAKPELPPDLAALSGKGLFFAAIRPDQIYNSPIGKAMRAKMGKDLTEAENRFRKGVGLAPGEIERLSYYAPAATGQPIGAVAAVETINKAKLVSTFLGTAEESKHAGKVLFATKEGAAVAFLGDKHYLFGRVTELKEVLDTKPETGSLKAILSAATEKHSGLLGMSEDGLKEMGKNAPPLFQSLFKSRLGKVTAHLDESLVVKGLLKFADADEAKGGIRALDMAKALMVAAGEANVEVMAKQKDSEAMAKILGDLLDDAKKVKFTSKDGEVSMEMTSKIDAGKLAVAVATMTKSVRDAEPRLKSANNLKQIGIALHNYSDTHNAFPAAAICDKDGKPLLSWRVAILPYIEQQALYDEFKLNEPWDSAHNKKLLAKMPKIYASPAGNAAEPHGTFYQALVGENAAFNLRKGLKLAEFTDGLSNTFMVAEGAKDVPWSKPDELTYDGKTLPKLGGIFPQGFHAVFGDGSVRFLAKDLKPKTLRLLILRNDGEVINFND